MIFINPDEGSGSGSRGSGSPTSVAPRPESVRAPETLVLDRPRPAPPGEAAHAADPEVASPWPGLRFEVLGDVRVRAAGGADVAGNWVKPRTVLAALLMDLNNLVTVETLVDIVWEDSPPRTARNSLQWLVSRVRHGLAAANAQRHGVTLRTTPAGYRLCADPAVVDLFRFRRLITAARTGADEVASSELAGRAMALWRGAALAGVTGSWADRVRHELRQERIAGLATLFDLELRLGRHHHIVDQLRSATEREPLSEVLAAQLMLALYRSGWDAEALGWYALLRQRTIKAVGAEPGIRLRQLHAQILRGEAAR